MTLPRLFSEAGYRVGHFGKWHMGGQRDVGDAPLIPEYGFDESLANFEGWGQGCCRFAMPTTASRRVGTTWAAPGWATGRSPGRTGQ